MSQTMPAFCELHFGHLDASQEAIEEPDLLVEGYFDYREAAYGIAVGQNWLLLGPKGSGKSAVLEYLRLTWEQRSDRFFTAWPLGGFPVNDVTHIETGQSAGGSRAQAAWEFLLLLRIVESLSRDQGLRSTSDFDRMVNGLTRQGHLSGDWLSKVSRWTQTRVKFDIKAVGAERTFDSESITPLELSAYIREQISAVSTDNRHIVALDGLDSFFFEAADEWKSLAGLTQAMYAVNRLLRSQELPVSIVAAMRSDIFDVLPGPEVTKLKPHAAHLDWHANGIGAKNHLWTLLDTKARVRHHEVKNIVGQYLNTPIAIGPHRELAEFLLDNTRLLPRDAVAMMTYVQAEYRGNKSVTEASAKRAVQRYAEEYFVSEIFDNLAGVLSSDRARALQSFKDALRASPSRLFDFAYLVDELKDELAPTEIKLLLRQMFETGGIGVYDRGHVDFVFRKISGAGFTTRYRFMLHDALTRAWSLRWRED